MSSPQEHIDKTEQAWMEGALSGLEGTYLFFDHVLREHLRTQMSVAIFRARGRSQASFVDILRHHGASRPLLADACARGRPINAIVVVQRATSRVRCALHGQYPRNEYEFRDFESVSEGSKAPSTHRIVVRYDEQRYPKEGEAGDMGVSFGLSLTRRARARFKLPAVATYSSTCIFDCFLHRRGSGGRARGPATVKALDARASISGESGSGARVSGLRKDRDDEHDREPGRVVKPPPIHTCRENNATVGRATAGLHSLSSVTNCFVSVAGFQAGGTPISIWSRAETIIPHLDLGGGMYISVPSGLRCASVETDIFEPSGGAALDSLLLPTLAHSPDSLPFAYRQGATNEAWSRAPYISTVPSSMRPAHLPLERLSSSRRIARPVVRSHETLGGYTVRLCARVSVIGHHSPSLVRVRRSELSAHIPFRPTYFYLERLARAGACARSRRPPRIELRTRFLAADHVVSVVEAPTYAASRQEQALSRAKGEGGDFGARISAGSAVGTCEPLVILVPPSLTRPRPEVIEGNNTEDLHAFVPATVHARVPRPSSSDRRSSPVLHPSRIPRRLRYGGCIRLPQRGAYLVDVPRRIWAYGAGVRQPAACEGKALTAEYEFRATEVPSARTSVPRGLYVLAGLTHRRPLYVFILVPASETAILVRSAARGPPSALVHDRQRTTTSILCFRHRPLSPVHTPNFRPTPLPPPPGVHVRGDSTLLVQKLLGSLVRAAPPTASFCVVTGELLDVRYIWAAVSTSLRTDFAVVRSPLAHLSGSVTFLPQCHGGSSPMELAVLSSLMYSIPGAYTGRLKQRAAGARAYALRFALVASAAV
ncbi:hypothetical protein C8F04DRAFT_1404337 [Mycena alexandri]|uniref:Uncharacterized protein n=1 Tax=Mycena alexandri TaxID=1745969 RepID=A0AAD6WM52_9AGAR|nr:hypothetical protein C8F04DRAFT_1404337 [Mycena alexandri]